jgi:tRNA threonylcarbamoyladenosine biosynthesis protein TsaB
MKKTAKETLHPMILAIETATMCGSVALIARDHCLAEVSIDTATTHSRRLIQQVDQVMRKTETNWDGIDAVAVSLGPGSFTGLRIGLSTAKGLCLATELPLLGIPTLDGLARQITALPGTMILAVLDARKKEVYGAFYRSNKAGIPEKVGKYMVMSPAEMAAMIDEPTIRVGDGAVLYRKVFTEQAGASLVFTPSPTFFPRAATIGLIGSELFTSDDFVDPDTVVPFYVRPSEAELSIKSPD